MSKYRAVKTVCDGITFASKAEARRYAELLLLQKAGQICNLSLQPQWKIEVGGKKICHYIADFSYHDINGRGFVVEDVKGMKTPVYRLKKKLVEALYGISITEIQ